MKTTTKIRTLWTLASATGLILIVSLAMKPIRIEDQTPKGYWIVNSDIKDEAGHKAYIAANREVFKRYDAKFLVRWGQKQIVEGTASRSKQVIIEFKSYADAVACYHTPEYEAAHKLRMGGVAETDMVIVEGFAGPLPNH